MTHALLRDEVEKALAWHRGTAGMRPNCPPDLAGCSTSALKAILRMLGAAPPIPPPGFAGIRGRVLGEAIDGAHVVRLVEYAFPDGAVVPYVEMHETHDGARPGKVLSLSAAVHLVQNVGENEVWEIGNR